MLIGQLPVDEQLNALRVTLTRNEPLTEVLARAAKLDLVHRMSISGVDRSATRSNV